MRRRPKYQASISPLQLPESAMRTCLLAHLAVTNSRQLYLNRLRSEQRPFSRLERFFFPALPRCSSTYIWQYAGCRTRRSKTSRPAQDATSPAVGGPSDAGLPAHGAIVTASECTPTPVTAQPLP
jgi:hypothetical protein